ncbi:ABC transporter ATP-binding protein [Agromyces binzhouensis]|uniref:ABC transporter ATP-binding protein n=1 Tax=Agromyces binzhouensis TaxID=1817495 RepID=UPI00362E4AAD
MSDRRGESVASEQGRDGSASAGGKSAGRTTAAKSAAARSSAAKVAASKSAATKSSTKSTAAKSAATRSTAAKRASAARATTAADDATDTTAAEPVKPAAKRSSGARKPAASSGAAKRPASAAAAKRASAKASADARASDSGDGGAEASGSAPKRAAAARGESATTSAARGKSAKSARAASAAAARSRAAEARKAAASARERVAASVTTETTEAEPRQRRSTPEPAAPTDVAAEPIADEAPAESPAESAPVEAPAERDDVVATTADESADVVRAAEVTRTWHPGGPDETPAATDEPGDADSSVEVVTDDAGDLEADPAVDADADAAVVGTDLTGDAILLVGDDSTTAAEGPAEAAEPATDAELAEPTDAELAELADAPEPAPGGDDHEGERGVAVIPLGGVAAITTPAARKQRTIRVAREAPASDVPVVLSIEGLVKRFGDTTAVDAISLGIRAGSFYGIVGPNGAGKTTTLSMITGLLRPDGGSVHVNGIDVWKEPRAAKRITGVLPDRLRLFDRLTGAEMLYYAGSLRGLDHRTVLDRSADLADAFGLEDALDRLVADYSAGMTKKIALACAMIHSPRMLVLDEPFESVDPVSAANLTDILERYVAGGGTVLLSSHSMDLIERVCDSAAIIVGGRVLASGTLDEVRRGDTLEDRFVELAGGRKAAEGMEWLHSFSD